MMMWTAKPNISNKLHMKSFDNKKDAVDYLTEVTGYEMQWENVVLEDGTKDRIYDWELVGKLWYK